MAFPEPGSVRPWPVDARAHRWRRRVGVTMVVVGSAVVLTGLWLLVTGLVARSQLIQAGAEMRQLRSQITAGDVTGGRASAQDLSIHARRAQWLTSGPAWALAAQLPGGEPLRSGRGITAAIDQLGSDVLPALIQARDGLDPAKLRHPDGSIDLALLSSSAPALKQAYASLSTATERVDGLPRNTWASPVDAARTELAAQLTALSSEVRGAVLAVQIVPPMLGQSGPRQYFVAFQNEAEARGTGGLPGAFAIVQADQGRVTITRFESDNTLNGVSADVNLGPEYDQLYDGANSTRAYVNSNLSPHFPYAAQIWASMWRKYSGQRVDGAVAVDPTVLSYLLAVAGPAPLPDGTVVSTDNVVALTQSTVYAKFADDTEGRKKYLLELAGTVSRHVLGSTGTTTALVKAAGKAADERRLLVWSADPAIQSLLEQTSVSGEIPATTTPYVGLSVVNDGGNKLDYYLDRELTWQRRGCGAKREVTVTITLRNNAPASGLSQYVTSRSDLRSYPVNPGDNRLEVSYLASAGALMDEVTVDGRAYTARAGSEHGHPLYTVNLELPRGSSRTVVLHLSEPGGTGSPTVLRQPLVRPLSVTLDDSGCPAQHE